MTIFEMRQKMPVKETLSWIKYFNESVEEKPQIDLNSASPEQLKGLFG
jgi:hypothetical protein